MTETEWRRLRRGDVLTHADGDGYVVDRVGAQGRVVLVRTLEASNPLEWTRWVWPPDEAPIPAAREPAASGAQASAAPVMEPPRDGEGHRAWEPRPALEALLREAAAPAVRAAAMAYAWEGLAYYRREAATWEATAAANLRAASYWMAEAERAQAACEEAQERVQAMMATATRET